MCFLEVAGVSTTLTPFVCTASYYDACHSGVRNFPKLRVYFSNFPGSSAPGIPFLPRCHAFSGSGRRHYKVHTLALHSLSL